MAQENKKHSENKEHMVLISTEYGDMKVRLYNETPAHRDNFLKLAGEGYFNGTLFHRVIKGFMIQGGDPDSKGAPAGKPLGMGGPGYTVPAEFHPELIHKKGAICAARTNNPQKASSGSQFYIVQGKAYSDAEWDQMASRLPAKYTEEQANAYKTLGGTPHLDQGYTVFGEVVSGIEVVDKIAALQVDRSAGDRPVKDVKMTVKVVE